MIAGTTNFFSFTFYKDFGIRCCWRWNLFIYLRKLICNFTRLIRKSLCVPEWALHFEERFYVARLNGPGSISNVVLGLLFLFLFFALKAVSLWFWAQRIDVKSLLLLAHHSCEIGIDIWRFLIRIWARTLEIENVFLAWTLLRYHVATQLDCWSPPYPCLAFLPLPLFDSSKKKPQVSRDKLATSLRAWPLLLFGRLPHFGKTVRQMDFDTLFYWFLVHGVFRYNLCLKILLRIVLRIIRQGNRVRAILVC